MVSRAGSPRCARPLRTPASRAVGCDAAEVIVVNGSQQALDLIARVLIERGDRVAIEDPSYQGAERGVLPRARICFRLRWTMKA